MISSTTIPQLAARAGLTDFHVLGTPSETVVRWNLYGVMHVSRIRDGEPVLHVVELAGSLRSPFAFGAHGLFLANDAQLAAWLQQQPAATQLVQFANARVPWVIQARPRGATSRVAFLDATGTMFDAAKATFAAVASLLPRGDSHAEQAFGYACDADALYESASQPPRDVRADRFVSDVSQLTEAARLQSALSALPIMGPKGSETARFNEAFRLIPNQKFAEAVTTFEALAREFPHRADDAYSQSGAALYFLGRYEEAIAHYRRALELGADASMMNDNIVEAEEAIRKRRS